MSGKTAKAIRKINAEAGGNKNTYRRLKRAYVRRMAK